MSDSAINTPSKDQHALNLCCSAWNCLSTYAIIVTTGTQHQSCWLAEACETLSLFLPASQPACKSCQHAQRPPQCILAASSPSGSVVRQGAEETSLATSRSTSTSKCSSGFTYISRRKGLLSLAASSLSPAYQPKHSNESGQHASQASLLQQRTCFTRAPVFYVQTSQACFTAPKGISDALLAIKSA